MFLTEDEAKKKWCPMTQVYPMSNATSVGGLPGTNQGYRCVASACMMWRQAPFYKHGRTGEAPMKPGAYPVGTATECGYCGLAGTPAVMDTAD